MTNDPTGRMPTDEEAAASHEYVSGLPDETNDDGQPHLTAVEWYMLMRLRGGTMTKNKFRNWLRKATRGGLVERYQDGRGRPCIRLTEKGKGSHG